MGYRLGNPYSAALLLTAALIGLLAAFTFRNREQRAARPLFALLVGIGFWCLGDALRYAAPTRGAVLLTNRVAYLGVVIVAPSLLLFTLSFTDRRRWLRRRYVLGLVAVSALTYAVVLTNPIHGLWLEPASVTPGTAPPVLTEDWGPAWYLWAVYAYATVLVSVSLMAREFRSADQSPTRRGQTGLVLAGVLFAAAVNALFISEVVQFDPVPFGFAVTGGCFGLAIFRYRLLTMLPIARETVLENMDSGVLVVDDAGRAVDANERTREMFDLREGELRGVPASRLFDDHPAVRDHLEGSPPDDPVTVEWDGETHHYDVESSRLTDAVGAELGRVLVFTDVTDRVDRQERLRRRTAELERTNERLDRFASVVSHDLRNPLNVVAGRTELALEEDDPTEHLQEIAEATDRMEDMIADLLTLARQGEPVGETEPVRLDELADTAWRHVDTGGATLTCETDATIQADPDRLQTVLENLFRNSVEHGSTGGRAGPDDAVEHGGTGDPGDGTVRVRVGDLDGGFYVADDGPGIPPAERDRVLEPGYTTDPDGTGFGLDIVREIADAHGWDLSVTESDDGGARFEFTGVRRG